MRGQAAISFGVTLDWSRKWHEFSEPVITLLRSGVHLRRGQWRSSVNVRRYNKTTFFQLVDDVNLKKKSRFARNLLFLIWTQNCSSTSTLGANNG